jgi:hypothetical protein
VILPTRSRPIATSKKTRGSGDIAFASALGATEPRARVALTRVRCAATAATSDIAITRRTARAARRSSPWVKIA